MFSSPLPWAHPPCRMLYQERRFPDSKTKEPLRRSYELMIEQSRYVGMLE